MFGLSKREQRWKEERRLAELMVGLAAVAIKANAEIRIAEANAEVARLAALPKPLVERLENN